MNEFYFFRVVYNIASFFIFSFYLILLYKSTNSFIALIIDSIIFNTFIWVGIILGSFLIERFGYVKVFKLSFIFLGLAAIVIAFNVKSIASLYIFFTILRSIPRGIYWQVVHAYQLAEQPLSERNISINIVDSLSYFFNIIFPFLVGSVITLSGDYFIIFFAGGIILILATFLSWEYNKKPKSKLTSDEVVRIIKHPQFKQFAIINIIQAGMASNLGIILIILPFLFLKTEFGIGVFASLINIVAAFIIFTHRKLNIKKGIRLGYFGTIIYALIDVIFSFIFNFPLLVIRNLTVSFSNSLTDPVTEEIDWKIKDNILGQFKKESAAEMNLITETLYFIGRILFLCFLFLLLNLNLQDQLAALKITVFMEALWNIVYFTWMVRMLKRHP